jgi:uncharacterized protein
MTVKTMKNPLVINRIHLKEGNQKLHHELSAEELGVVNVILLGPVIIDLEIMKNSDMIVVSGNVTFKTRLSCANCLVDFDKEFSEKIYQEYIRGTKPITTSGGRIEDADFTREYFSGDFFDLTPVIRDIVQLAIPLAPWCREDCPGVC